MFTYLKDTRTDHERYLEDELARHQAADERRQREEDERREERRRDLHERIQEAERSADTWPEALRKQVHLCNREVAAGEEDLRGQPDEIDSFFANSAKAAEDALALWAKVEDSKQDEIDAAEQALEALRDSIRLEVADKLDAHGGSEWASTAAALRESSPAEFINW